MSQFANHGRRVLAVALAGTPVRAITGSMVAYEGEIAFKSAGMGGGDGLKAALKRKATGESLQLMECSGHGTVYFAVDAQDVTIIPVDGDVVQVESQQLLAVSEGLRLDVKFTGVRGASSGQGLFTTTVTGTGTIALLSAGGPLIGLQVDGSQPLVVDPQAFVASVGQLNPSFITDISWASAIGQGSGEPFSIRFDGVGVVYIQPEER